MKGANGVSDFLDMRDKNFQNLNAGAISADRAETPPFRPA
jgi:hypothetical protein